MRPETTTTITIPENPHMQILELNCSTLNHILELLNMQSNATMLIYASLPHLHIEFIKFGATVIKL